MAELVLLPLPSGPPLVDLAAALSPERWPVLLDGGPVPTELARWDYLAFDPVARLSRRGLDQPPAEPGSAWPAQLEGLLAAHGPADAGPAHRRDLPDDQPLPPFRGGLTLALSYDLGRELERLQCRLPRDADIPDLLVAVHPFVVAEDRASGRRMVIGHGTREQGLDLARRVAQLAGQVSAAPAQLAPVEALSSSMDRQQYEQAVARVRERILDGDVYQVNLAQRFEAQWPGRAADLQRHLRLASAAPFSGFLAWPGGALISSSPELFLRRRGQSVQSRPIKGTRPRGRDAADDEAQCAALVGSAKEQAELAMIVDLVRNDLGRSAELGSVSVELPFAVDAWKTVFHRVATVSARVPASVSSPALVAAAFPPASVTGTPKLSALAIIEQLEPVRRQLYTGAFGWLGFDGDCDLAVAIRVVTQVGRRLLLPVGGGITLASDPAAEYEETLHKAAGVFAALGLALPMPGGT